MCEQTLRSFDGLSAAIPPRAGEAGTTDTGAGLICVLPVDLENYERPSDLAAVRMKGGRIHQPVAGLCESERRAGRIFDDS